MDTICEYRLALPVASPDIIRSMLRTGLASDGQMASTSLNSGPSGRPFQWTDGSISDCSFPPTASRWGRTAVAGLLRCPDNVRRSWGLAALRKRGFRGAEGGEAIAFARSYPSLITDGRLLAPGQLWTDRRHNELMVCIGPHNGGQSVYLAPRQIQFPAGTMFLGIQD